MKAVPGLTQLKASLGIKEEDDTKIVIGGVVLLIIVGTIYAISSGRLASESTPLSPAAILPILAPLGKLKLVEPPAPPAPVEAAPTAVEPGTGPAAISTPAAEGVCIGRIGRRGADDCRT